VKSDTDESSENRAILRDIADENRGPTVRNRMLGDFLETSGGPRMDRFRMACLNEAARRPTLPLLLGP
jgi:hypothetical protein